MPKEDYLQKYLEKLSRVIAAMTGLRETGYPEDAERMADAFYSDLLKYNLSALSALSSEQFVDLVVKAGYTSAYVEAMATLAYEVGNVYEFRENMDFARSFYLKSLLLFLFLNEKDKTFSFERENRISELKIRIDS